MKGSLFEGAFCLRKIIACLLIMIMFAGCGARPEPVDIAASTGPVAQAATRLVAGTELTVGQLVTDSVSCLHDYSLSVRQMELIDQSDLVLISGAGLEEAMEDALPAAGLVVDCSEGLPLADGDPHYWLDPLLYAELAENAADALSAQYPQHADVIADNLTAFHQELEALNTLGNEMLQTLSCRQLITFHDGFAYLANAFDLEILAAIEEEAGSEASAKDLTEIIGLVEEYRLPAVFTEKNGSDASARVICQETDISCYTLDMAMNGDYFTVMEQNFRTLQEALR